MLTSLCSAVADCEQEQVKIFISNNDGVQRSDEIRNDLEPKCLQLNSEMVTVK